VANRAERALGPLSPPRRFSRAVLAAERLVTRAAHLERCPMFCCVPIRWALEAASGIAGVANDQLDWRPKLWGQFCRCAR